MGTPPLGPRQAVHTGLPEDPAFHVAPVHTAACREGSGLRGSSMVISRRCRNRLFSEQVLNHSSLSDRVVAPDPTRLELERWLAPP